jgi:nitroreductase
VTEQNDERPAWLPADKAITTRRSVRAYLPTPVPRAVVEELLALASRAPSGSNVQPWKVRVLAGEVRSNLTRAILAALDRDGPDSFVRGYNYYPVKWQEPYLGRRRKVGWDLYSLLGIGRGDFEESERHKRRNYEFFGAPVGMIVTIDRVLETGSWLDLGMFLGSLMVAARGRGLDTCAQAAFATAHKVVREQLAIPETETVVCGMALGYADSGALINRLETTRASPAEFASFAGF